MDELSLPERIDPVLRRGPLVFVDDLDAPELDRDDERHLMRALRVPPGASVCIADGRGRWRPARLGVGGSLEPIGEVMEQPWPRSPLTVAVAPPKGDRPGWIVAKLTELAVDRIVFLETERSVVRWDAGRADQQRARFAKVAREAAMQSRRCRLPTVEVGLRPADVVGPGIVVTDPCGSIGWPATATTALVGPEGGWTEGECDAALPRVSLGPAVLRTETAALAAAVRLGIARGSLSGQRYVQ